MKSFLKKKSCPIGIDVSDTSVRLVQVDNTGPVIRLNAGGSRNCPVDIVPGTGLWQRWAIDAIKEMLSEKKFQGRQVVAAIPATDVFIDHMKMPKNLKGSLEQTVLPKLQSKLSFDAGQAVIKCVSSEDSNVIALVADRQKIDRYLAVYERAGLQIKSLAVWPLALINSYTNFFGRREADHNSVVELIDIQPDCTNVVICRHSQLMYARSINIGSKRLESEQSKEATNRLLVELNNNRKGFASMYKDNDIERLIFVSGQAADRDVCVSLAKQLKIPAQMGDCLKATEISGLNGSGIDRRSNRLNWATAFGLSLSTN